MRRSAALTLTTLFVGAAGQVLAGAALADAPVKTGWWNAASANGAVLPAPTTGPDNLRVGQGPNGPSAYAAVAYDLTGQDITGGTLQLKVAPDSTVGTIDVMACPTADATWKPGGNQPITAAPKYDCAAGLPGIRATDGSTVTFLLGAAQALPGGFSVAIVPASDALPFTVDFVKPDATSFAPDAGSATEPAATADGSTGDTPAPPSSDGGAGNSGGVAFSPGTLPQTGAFVPPPAVESAPLAPVPAAAPAPVPNNTTPAVASRPLVPVSNRERYQAGTLLALLAGALVYACQQPTAARRRIGGLARADGPAALDAVDSRPRGIGRFATVRTAPARRLV